jgi:hypothetical protein
MPEGVRRRLKHKNKYIKFNHLALFGVQLTIAKHDCNKETRSCEPMNGNEGDEVGFTC